MHLYRWNYQKVFPLKQNNDILEHMNNVLCFMVCIYVIYYVYGIYYVYVYYVYVCILVCILYLDFTCIETESTEEHISL